MELGPECPNCKTSLMKSLKSNEEKAVEALVNIQALISESEINGISSHSAVQPEDV